MGEIQIRFLGSGDAFGSGGRLQTCIHLKSASSQFLLDCGASVLTAMKRFYVQPNDIEAIVVSHFHGDHFGGIPFFLLDAQLVSKRSKPLILAGPAGLEQKLIEAMEVMFPGSSKVAQKFALEYVELIPGKTEKLMGMEIDSFPAAHTSGVPSLLLRIKLDGKTIAFTGDTEWTDSLIPACKDADLLISEAYFFDKKIKFHMNYMTLREKMDELRYKRLIITHLGKDMLQRIAEVDCDYAEDGKVFCL